MIVPPRRPDLLDSAAESPTVNRDRLAGHPPCRNRRLRNGSSTSGHDASPAQRSPKSITRSWFPGPSIPASRRSPRRRRCWHGVKASRHVPRVWFGRHPGVGAAATDYCGLGLSYAVEAGGRGRTPKRSRERICRNEARYGTSRRLTTRLPQLPMRAHVIKGRNDRSWPPHRPQDVE
jgi:hypothetical protein